MMIKPVMALDKRPSPPNLEVKPGLAFDRASVRSYDKDGRLHVAITHISKATVDLYYGREIPGFEELGLLPDKAYYLLRDPQEIAKAAKTFNNLPILSKHIPVTAEAPQKEFVVGSTGTDAEFTAPFLDNSAVVWDKDSIDLIESDEQKEWSCGYYYTPDMTPGNFNGLRYDGVMRDMVGNHVALVKDGRAGPDVVVGDSKPERMGIMVKITSRRALMLSGALVAHIAPKLAMDAKAVDLSGALKGVTAKTLGKSVNAVAGRVMDTLKGAKMATDESVDVADVVAIIKAVDGIEAPADEDDAIADAEPEPAVEPPAVDDTGMASKILAFLKGKISDEDMATLSSMCDGTAEDDDPDMTEDDEPEAPPGGQPPAPKKDTPAMDAKAVARIVNDMREAERAVEPHIGKVTVAQDSPEAIYKMALDAKGVETKGVPPKAFKAMVGMLGQKAPASTTGGLAMDHAAGATDFDKRFPNASPILAS